jgi:hypothetical protein
MADDSDVMGLEGPTAPAERTSSVRGNGMVAAPAAHGWYGRGPNPNEQSYWDGERWTGERHWIAGAGWTEGSLAASRSDAQGAPLKASANPYVQAVPPAPSRSRGVRAATPATFNVSVLLTVVAGIALMYGSVATWIDVHANVGVAQFHASLNGIDQGITTLIGVNGYVTFIGGIVVLVLGALALSSEERLLVILTTVVSLAVLVFAIYDMFRVVQKLSQLPATVNPSVSVGWGLICVLGAASLAVVVSLARLLQQR